MPPDMPAYPCIAGSTRAAGGGGCRGTAAATLGTGAGMEIGRGLAGAAGVAGAAGAAGAANEMGSRVVDCAAELGRPAATWR